MSITLRKLKSSALSYNEMDRNLSQFFYSASLTNGGGTLQLHYTGSSLLNEGGVNYAPRTIDVPLDAGSSNLSITGSAGIDLQLLDNGQTQIINTGNASPGDPFQSIQFNKESSFAGDSTFLYNSDKKRVGLGFTSTLSIARRLHIVGASSQGAIIRLQSFFDINPLNIGGVDETAFLEISSGGISSRENPDNIFGKFGKVDQGEDPQLHINRYVASGKTHFSFGQEHTISHTVKSTAIAINATDTKRNLAVVGNHGIVIGYDQDSHENRIRPLTNDVFGNSFIQLGVEDTPPLNVTKIGLAIHSPMNQDDGGNILIGISDSLDGVNSVNGRHPNRLLINSYADRDSMTIEAKPVNPIASFLSNGTTGIGTPNPNTNIRLDVNGQYRGAYFETNVPEKLDFKNYSVILLTVRQGTTEVALRDTVIPPEGTKAVLILNPIDSNDYRVILEEDERLITGEDLTVFSNRFSTITFVSNGRFLIETSRTIKLN